MAYSGTLSGAAFGRRFIRSETIAGSNIDSAAFATFFTFCMAVYLSIYALEAPIRYGLFLAGKDSLILIRDSLILAPLFFLAASQSLRLQLHAGFVVWAVIMAFHAMVLIGTVGSPEGAVYGAKVLVNLLFGFFAAGLLISPGPRMTRWMAFLWFLIVLGVCLEKGGMTFPWTGIKTVIGDLSVDVSKDWEITDPLAKRVAGFTRSSIAVAAILPCLTIVLLCKMKSETAKHLIFKGLVALAAIGSVFMTTQKGSIIALIPIAAILCVQPTRQPARLRLAFLFFLVLSIALPLWTLGVHMKHGAGVFSTESLYLRVAYTWPDAWKWITHHQMLWFGVGLGGIGGPQRLYAPDAFNPSDNIAVLLYGYFGIFAILYVGIVSVLALRPVTGSIQRVTPALGILAFAFGYGIVLSVVEDQALSLFLGAAVGVLWRETRNSVIPSEASCRTV